MATTMYARLNSSRTEGTIVRELRAHESPSNDIPDGMVAIDVSGLDRVPAPGERVTVDSDGCATDFVASDDEYKEFPCSTCGEPIEVGRQCGDCQIASFRAREEWLAHCDPNGGMSYPSDPHDLA